MNEERKRDDAKGRGIKAKDDVERSGGNGVDKDEGRGSGGKEEADGSKYSSSKIGDISHFLGRRAFLSRTYFDFLNGDENTHSHCSCHQGRHLITNSSDSR